MFFENYNSASRDFPYIDEATDISYLPHFHNELELALVLWGNITAFSESVSYEADAGDVLVFMPSELHSYTTPKESKLLVIKINTENSFSGVDFSSMRMNSNIIKSSDPKGERICALMRETLCEFKEKRPGFAYKADSLSKDILCTLIRSETLTEINGDDMKKRRVYISLLSSVDEYIRLNYMYNISLNDISAHCNLSVFYFSHVFKKATGTTFYDYLTAYRLDKAMELLRGTNKKIINIATECGFDTARTFNRSFKKFFGKSPTEYLNNGRRGTL